MTNRKIFYIYLDWTLEEIPRVFYVGKGNEARLKVLKRNKYWEHIRQKHGWRREVIFASWDEGYSFQIEKQLITYHKTYEKAWSDNSGWGANFTTGGEGASGIKISEETRRKMSLSKSGKNHPFYGKKLPEETRRKMSASRSGEKNPLYGKCGKDNPLFGRTASAETRKLMSISAAGENNNMAKLTWDKVNQIKKLLAEHKLSHSKIAKLFGICRSLVGLIANNQRWII